MLDYINDQDWESAYALLKSRDAQGDENATAILGECYINGVGVPEDVATGIELLEKAISRGNIQALDILGTLYVCGEKVPCDNEKGVSYFQRGAEMGDSFCMDMLATAYFEGVGVPVDYSKAYEWGMKAAELGRTCSMQTIAAMYDDGLGVQRNPIYAAHWYRKCLQQDPDNTFCIYRLAICLADPFEMFHSHPDDSMLEEAYFWACKGVEKDVLDCYTILAWFYEMGKVVNQDSNMAYKYFKIAANKGHEESIKIMNSYRRNIFGDYYLPQ